MAEETRQAEAGAVVVIRKAKQAWGWMGNMAPYDVEADGKGLPILLRQYAKIGGKLLGFNVDRKFSNVLDGLVVVDLRQTDPAVLDRYMGREAAQSFRKIHGMAKV